VPNGDDNGAPLWFSLMLSGTHAPTAHAMLIIIAPLRA